MLRLILPALAVGVLMGVPAAYGQTVQSRPTAPNASSSAPRDVPSRQEGRPIETSAGTVGIRQTRQEDSIPVEPVVRIDTRLQTRINTRLETRLDRDYVPVGSETTAYRRADARVRDITRRGTANRPRR